MAISQRDISHNDGLAREVAEVYHEYGEVLKRLRDVGTSENSVTEDLYRSALYIYADTLTDLDSLARMSGSERRQALTVLATLALRWARKIRVG